MNLRVLLSLALTGLLGATCASADELSGPLRQTLASEAWGTLFYSPSELKSYDYTPDPAQGLRLMKSALGEVSVKDSSIGCYNVSYPKGKMVVDSAPGAVNVTFFGQKYEFHRVNNPTANEFVVKLPDDEIHYVITGHEIKVTGRKGKTDIQETEGDYRVESSVGNYTYTATPAGGFRVRGGPLAHFPYLYRGAVFESAGVGVFIDFKKLDPESPLFRFIEWQPLLLFQQ